MIRQEHATSYNFDKIIGFSEFQLRLFDLVLRNVFPAVSILSGRKGIGKGLLAIKIAAAHLCKNMTACGLCLSCQEIKKGTHPEVFYLEPSEKNKINLEAVKPLQEFLEFNPGEYLDSGVDRSRGRQKVVVIKGFDSLNVQGQNRLLKTLEEPPDFAKIILTVSEPKKVLATIFSRCVSFKLAPPEMSESLDLIQEGLDNGRI